MSAERGRTASEPTEIPASGWKDIALRVKEEIKDDHTTLTAAGVAFYGFVALIPGLTAVISLYGIFADPQQVERQLGELMGNFPQEAQALMTDQMSRLADQPAGALTWATILAVAIALWTASTGMANLLEAINITYDEDDERGFLAKRGLALLLTLGAVITLILLVGAVGLIGPWLAEATGSAALAWIGRMVTWVLVGLVAMAALAVIYRVGPKRDDPEWEWVSVGAVVAVVLWVITSILFQIYVANFGSYNEVYGSLAAVVILLFWLFITSFIVLLGAQINSEMEHQTREDTTTGSDEPMGRRGAVVADTLGETEPDD